MTCNFLELEIFLSPAGFKFLLTFLTILYGIKYGYIFHMSILFFPRDDNKKKKNILLKIKIKIKIINVDRKTVSGAIKLDGRP